MGLILLIIYILLTLTLYKKRNLFFSITMIYVIIAPDIKFGNFDISAIYFVIIYLFAIFALERKYVLFINKENKDYLFLIIFNFVLYFTMTLIKNNTLSNSGISSIIGFLKIPLCIITIMTLFKDEIKNKDNYDIIFKVAVLINLIGVILQFMFSYKIRSFFENMYLTNDYIYYQGLSDENVYNRKFGFFPSPMVLGIFSLLSFSYFFVRYKEEESIKNLIYMSISLIIGLTSLSKTFILGVPIFIIINFILNIILKKKSSKKGTSKRIKLFIIVLPILILIFITMYSYMSKTTSINYYLRMLKNPVQALQSRYDIGSDDLLLSETYDVIKENILFGVGFQSIRNEFLGDSSYVLALHNGGMVSLISILIFYFINILKAFKNSSNKKILFLLVWILSGLAMPILYNTIMVLPFYLYFFTSEKLEGRL